MTFFLLLVAIGALAWVLSRNQSLSRMQAKLQQDVTFLKMKIGNNHNTAITND
jgi:sensor domain CHASE-containing protein